MIEPMYRVEMAPINQTGMKSGGRSTDFPTTGRVLETYRGSHIGCFWNGADGDLNIAVYIRDGSSGRVVETDRLDPAIHEIWKEYFNSLTFWPRLVRRLYSHRPWIAAFVVSVISSSIVLTIDSVWFTSP